MAEVTIVKKGGVRFPPSMEIVLGGVTVLFVRAWVDNERAMVAKLDDSDPGVVAALRQAAMMPGTFRVHSPRAKIAPEDSIEIPVSRPSQAPPAVDGDGGADDAPRRAAIHNGWTEEDLAGTGQGGAWDARGGRSAVSGMSMAEMSMCSPPAGWRRQEQYPWDVLGWHGPTTTWKPPKLPAKGPPVDPVVADDGEGESEGEGEATGPTDTPPVQPARAKAPKSKAGADPDLEAYGSATQVSQATAILQELAALGQSPTRQKAGYHLRKHGLPSPTEQQFAALLRSASTP